LLDNDNVVDFDWSACSTIVDGSIRVGGQEHFYLEPHGCVVIPGECDEMTVISSTQCVNDVQVIFRYD
jgi:xanthine dehydrogenase molybdopterin-binding subunit B